LEQSKQIAKQKYSKPDIPFTLSIDRPQIYRPENRSRHGKRQQTLQPIEIAEFKLEKNYRLVNNKENNPPGYSQ